MSIYNIIYIHIYIHVSRVDISDVEVVLEHIDNFTLQQTSSHISGILQAPTAAAPVFPPLDCCKVCPLRPDHPRSSLSQKKSVSLGPGEVVKVKFIYRMIGICSESHGWHMLALTDLSALTGLVPVAQAIKKLRSDWSVIQQIEMWESQCQKPTIWGWFIAPSKMVILGMVYGIGFKFSTIWMSLKQLEDVGRCWKDYLSRPVPLILSGLSWLSSMKQHETTSRWSRSTSSHTSCQASW